MAVKNADILKALDEMGDNLSKLADRVSTLETKPSETVEVKKFIDDFGKQLDAVREVSSKGFNSVAADLQAQDGLIAEALQTVKTAVGGQTFNPDGLIERVENLSNILTKTVDVIADFEERIQKIEKTIFY